MKRTIESSWTFSKLTNDVPRGVLLLNVQGNMENIFSKLLGKKVKEGNTNMASSSSSGNILIGIKKKHNDYQIPNGFMYKYISCPNYFGEIIEWVGFYIVTASAPALVFVFWTMCNLIPRAISNHNWYLNKFSDYPKNRKAVIPFLI